MVGGQLGQLGLDATYFVDLAVLGNCLIVLLFGDILFQGHGLEDAIVPLERCRLIVIFHVFDRNISRSRAPE